MKLSICIPTFNRSIHLANCLNSILICKLNSSHDFQVCVSDNHSTDNTKSIVQKISLELNIKYSRNDKNLGLARNFLKVVSMADGDFVWIVGDDDLLMPQAIEKLYKLIDEHSDVDFLYVNSFNLKAEYLDSFPKPFNTSNLPNNMERFSKSKNTGEMQFFDLIDPKVSFDFLGGMFLSVFRKKNWAMNVDILNEDALNSSQIFSHFDNTFPHIKIFARAFSKSKAYFNDEPFIVSLSGVREWSNLYPLVHSIRMVEGLKEYRNNGLPYWNYVYCKNYALNNFIPEFTYLIIYKKSSGYAYINPIQIILESVLYPNTYLSFFYFILRRFRRIMKRIFNIL
ncbi:glycosyltransferase family 2 protein [Candidatus Pseudothioglobus singularis]|nr:glycosyltransferase family 2 protein [Candidatus Pseudothioglobus singularis]